MSLLNEVKSQLAPSAPKGIVYGGAGEGKTTYAANAGNSIIVDCENGAGAIKCTRTPYLSTWMEIYKWLLTLVNEKHDYRVVAIDSIDWLLRRIEEHVSGCASGKADATLNRSHGGYGNGKQVLKNYVYQMLLPIFDRLVERGIAVLLLAHAKRTEVTDIDGITVEKTTPEIADELLGVMVEWSDFVCLARKNDEGNRYLVTSETPRAMAKNRYNLPEVIDFTWAAFENAVVAGLSNTFNPNPKED